MSPAWDPKALMWQNQDCSQLSLALEIKQRHPYLFPVWDGNNRAGGGMFLRSFFLSLADGGAPDHLTCFLSCWHGGHCPQPCCGCYAPLCLMAHASQVIVRLYLEPTSHCGPCFISLLPFLSQCFERIVHACLHFFPICSLWRPLSLTSAPLPLLNRSLRGITHLRVGKSNDMCFVFTYWAFLLWLPHSLLRNSRPLVFMGLLFQFLFYFLDCFTVQTFLPAMCGILGLVPKCLWKPIGNLSETLWTCWCHVGSLKLAMVEYWHIEINKC